MRSLRPRLWLGALLACLLTAEPTQAQQPMGSGPPAPPPEKWRGWIGEYESKGSRLLVLEKDGNLFVHEGVLLNRIGHFKSPEKLSIYSGEVVKFEGLQKDRATRLVIGERILQRRPIDGEDGQTFKIAPLRPLAELRKEALQAKPPGEKPDLRQPELVDLATLDKTLKFDIRYATPNNFLSTKFYTSARAFLQKPAAAAMLRAHRKLKDAGYGLLIYDAYRPWHVTKMFWDATPPKLRNFVADPSQGSRHNRGCAVDLTLYDLKTGKPVEMVSGFDEFSDRAFPDYPGGTTRQRWHRDLLRRTMEAEGFSVYEEEWWHFDYQDWRLYPILNKHFEELP